MKKLIFSLLIVANSFVFPQQNEREIIFNHKDAWADTGAVAYFRKIEKIAIKNNLIKPKFKLGLELLRTDKQNQEIFLRKSEYPLQLSSKEIFVKNDFQFSVYDGEISFPLEIYNPNKKVFLEKSKKLKEVKSRYVLEVIPINRNDDTYTFKLTIMGFFLKFGYHMYKGQKYENNLGVGFQREINLRVGEKIKLDIELTKFPWKIDDIIDGKKIIFDSAKDYYNYFNDYLILSLESDK